MTTNEKLMKTICELVDNFADKEDKVGMTLLTLATNFLDNDYMAETLQKKWHIIEEENLEEGYQILPLLYGNLIDYYGDKY